MPALGKQNESHDEMCTRCSDVDENLCIRRRFSWANMLDGFRRESAQPNRKKITHISFLRAVPGGYMLLLIRCPRQVRCPRASSVIQRTSAVRKFGVSPDLRGAQIRCFSRLALCASRVFLRTCAYIYFFFFKKSRIFSAE